jgi:hypothetical protein
LVRARREGVISYIFRKCDQCTTILQPVVILNLEALNPKFKIDFFMKLTVFSKKLRWPNFIEDCQFSSN